MKITVQKDEWLLLNNNGGDFIGNYPESSYMPLKRKEQTKMNLDPSRKTKKLQRTQFSIFIVCEKFYNSTNSHFLIFLRRDIYDLRDATSKIFLQQITGG